MVRRPATFSAELFRWGEVAKGAWYFVAVPEDFAPPVTEGWGRTPVVATVDGVTWATSVWRGKDGRTLLAVPKRIRGPKKDGDRVEVRIDFQGRRPEPSARPVDPYAE